MRLRLRSPWPWILAACQTALAYALLRYSFEQERLHYVRRYEFDPGYVPWSKVLVVWMNAPVYIATFWTSFIWTNEEWEYTKLPGIFIFWLLLGCTFALPTRRNYQLTHWRYFVAAVGLLGWAVWEICDIVLSPFNWANRPEEYLRGRALMEFAIPAWLLFTAAWCFIQYSHSRNRRAVARYTAEL